MTRTTLVRATPSQQSDLRETFNLTLSSRSGAVISDAIGTGTIYDDDRTTVTGPKLAIGDVRVWEGDGGTPSAVFTVSLSKASGSNVDVKFATVNGSATGSDYTAKSGTLRFPSGVTSLNVSVAITPDILAEGDEVFRVTLASARGATITDGDAFGVIFNDD